MRRKYSVGEMPSAWPSAIEMWRKACSLFNVMLQSLANRRQRRVNVA
jgi:hypothetical protein